MASILTLGQWTPSVRPAAFSGRSGQLADIGIGAYGDPIAVIATLAPIRQTCRPLSVL